MCWLVEKAHLVMRVLIRSDHTNLTSSTANAFTLRDYEPCQLSGGLIRVRRPLPQWKFWCMTPQCKNTMHGLDMSYAVICNLSIIILINSRVLEDLICQEKILSSLTTPPQLGTRKMMTTTMRMVAMMTNLKGLLGIRSA